MYGFDYGKALKEIEHSGLKFTPYPQTKLINVEDKYGIIQSYYASTGTAVFRDSNHKYNAQRRTVRLMMCDEFIELCLDGDKIFDKYFSE